MRNSITRSATSRVCLAIALSLTLMFPARATESAPGAWLIFSTTGPIHPDDSENRWRYWFDAQGRFFDFGSGATQYLVRPALGYQVNDRTSAWFGYARFRSRSASGAYSDENRYWQQLSWNAGEIGGGRLSLRARLEQRDVSRGDDMGVTLRLMGKYVRPLGKPSRPNLVLAVEPFINLRSTDWGASSGLAQNRVFAGLGLKLSDSVYLETGYMNQFIWVDGGQNRNNHLALANFRVSF